MSEIKRVALNTLEPQKVNDKVIKKLCKTARISVILPESNEGYCPEINYKDQLAAVKKKSKQTKDAGTNGNSLENGLDPFGDNDDDVRRIALEMEAKYGTGVTGLQKKKRKGKKDDYADIGMGYDESDPFIDNTDGYDEIIPQNVTTLHGGFYVNSGALVFKTDDEASSEASSSSSSSDSSSSDSETEDKTKTKSRKRILDTSAESDSDTASTNQKEKKPKLQSPSVSMQQAIKKKLFSTAKIQVKKQKSLEQQKKTVKDLLREKREDLNMTLPDELKTIEDNIEKDSSKENKKPMNITSVTDAIESVVKQVVIETNYDNNQNKQSPEASTNIPVSDTIDLSESHSNENEMRVDLNKSTKQEDVKLPDDLPADITAIVSKLVEAALNYKGEGKKAFFTNEVNALLLSLEKKSKSVLSKSSRVKVYEHIAQYVKCTKDTLTRRAKLLELEECERRLANLKVKLKNSIDFVMPALMANYEQESQKILQKKFSKESAENEELKALKLPRRSFQWSEEAKKLVKDILSVKKRCLIIEGKHKDKLEEQILNFLRMDVLPLWPESWMYLNTLKKVYNSMRENSKSKASSSTVSKGNPSATKPPKHSNLSITPVTNGKNIAEKTEIANSITVTKVTSDVKSSESSKANTIQSEKNQSIASNNSVTENENRSIQSVHIENLPLSLEKTSDLSAHPKKSGVFKPYVSEPKVSQVQKLPASIENPQNVQKQTKHNDMFKPYADAVTAVDKIIPEKPKVSSFNETFLPTNEIIQQYLEKEKHSHSQTDKIKHNSHFERDKFNSYTYSDKDKHSTQSYSGKERHSSHPYSEKDKHSTHSYADKDKHSSHSYSDKDKHNSHSHSDRDKYSSRSYGEKDKHISRGYQEKDKHSPHSYSSKDKHSSQPERKSEEKTVHQTEKPRFENAKTSEKATDLSKNQLEKPRDLSKFQMFKPYSEITKTHFEEPTKYRSKDDVKHRPLDIPKVSTQATKTYISTDFITPRYDVAASKHNAAPSAEEECGVIVKNLQQINESIKNDNKKDHNPVIPKAAHCQGVNLTDKRKMLDPYSRSPAEMNPASFFPVATSTHSEYSAPSQMISNKSDGDGQKDIQMVMENLKALQKLSCSPVKNNDNSSSSPVSVIAYNKTFSSSKVNSTLSRNDSNSRGDSSSRFQDEFQKQFINSLQQMAANSSSNRSGYNNGS